MTDEAISIVTEQAPTEELELAPPPVMRRTLAYHEKLKLANWLGKNEERLRDGRVTRAKAAELASSELGFTVTAGNMQGAEEATGISYITPRAPSLAEQVAQLKIIVTVLKERVQVLENQEDKPTIPRAHDDH